MNITGLISKMALMAGMMLLGLAAACGGGDNAGDSGSLFPQRATVVGSVAAGEALDAIDLEFGQFLDMFSSGSQGEGDRFDKLFNISHFKSGGLFGDISRADIFGEITDGDDIDYFGLLLTGSFDEPALISALESISGIDLVPRDYKGVNVYSPAGDDHEFDLSVLDDATFVVGSGGSVNDVIDIKTGDAAPASGRLMDTFNRLDGGLFAFALKVPEGLAEEADSGSLMGLGDLPISLDFLSALDIVGLRGGLNDGTLELSVTMEFTSEEAAESLEGFISGIISLAGAFLPDPEMAGLLAGLEIDRDGSLLTIKIGIPLADIPDLLGDLTTATGAGSSDGRHPGTQESRALQAVIGEAVAIAPSVSHVPEGQRVEYRGTPPTSGEHWPSPERCGFYTESLPDERTVHNLEHGNVVVSYNFTNPAQTTELRHALDDVDQFDEWGLARPYDKIPDGQVALSAWGRLLIVEGVDQEEIELFFDAFAGALGPERIAC